MSSKEESTRDFDSGSESSEQTPSPPVQSEYVAANSGIPQELKIYFSNTAETYLQNHLVTLPREKRNIFNLPFNENKTFHQEAHARLIKKFIVFFQARRIFSCEKDEMIQGILGTQIETYLRVKNVMSSLHKDYVDLHLTTITPYLVEELINEYSLREIEALVMTDELTQLKNRRYFTLQLEKEMERSKRSGLPLSLIVLDLDHFKSINDTYGHLAGDKVLSQFAQLLQENLRRNDTASRYGGEEFVGILPDTSGENACLVAKRIVDKMKLKMIVLQQEFPHMKILKPINVTVSVGVSELSEEVNTPAKLFENADKELYILKGKLPDAQGEIRARRAHVSFNRNVLTG